MSELGFLGLKDDRITKNNRSERCTFYEEGIMRKYPKYKNSEIEYISEIPQHWDVWKLKYLVKDKLKYGANEAAELDDRSLPRYIRITDFNNDGKLKDETFKSLPYEIANDYLLKNGDILFARSGATVGKTLLFDNYDGIACFAGYLIKASCNEQKMNSEFLNYYTSSSSYENWKDMIFIQSTIQNIGADKYNLMMIPKPSLPEQLSIVRFLNHKTGQMDRFIANRQKQIELLKEQKAGIINKAVTGKIPMSELGLKGLKDDRIENTNASENQILPSSNPKNQNSDRKMKPSGIEWLPEVPETWKVMELKFAAKMMRGKFSHRPRNDERLYNGKYPFIQTGDVTKTEKYITSYKQTLNDWGFSVSKMFPKGTVVITIAANIGDIAILDFDACFPDSIVGFFSKQNKTEYLFYLLKSMKEVFLSESIEGTQLNLSVDRLSSIKVAIPTPSEQQKIIDFILLETSNTDTLISKYQKQIDLMQEYRTSLISQAVTGKIDVRENV